MVMEGLGDPEEQISRSEINTLRTGSFKLFKCTFSGSKQFK